MLRAALVRDGRALFAFICLEQFAGCLDTEEKGGWHESKRKERDEMAVEVMGTLIQIPQGDTGAVKFVPVQGTIAAGDMGVFTLAKRDGTPILRKLIEPDEQDNAFHMMFVHKDTALLRPGAYMWSMRVVRGGIFDAGGKLSDAQGMHTAVIRGRLVVLAVAGGAK